MSSNKIYMLSKCSASKPNLYAIAICRNTFFFKRDNLLLSHGRDTIFVRNRMPVVRSRVLDYHDFINLENRL